MIDPQYPYYRKLQKFLDKKQVAIYKNLTNKLSLIDSIDFNEVCVLKSYNKQKHHKVIFLKVLNHLSSLEIFFVS